MADKLYYNTVTPLLHSILKTVMVADEFKEFRLVGGTALSLYRGHRESVDIDLFTDAVYGTIDFDAINVFLRDTYPYVDTSSDNLIGFGKSYFISSTIYLRVSNAKNDSEVITLRKEAFVGCTPSE